MPADAAKREVQALIVLNWRKGSAGCLKILCKNIKSRVGLEFNRGLAY